MKFSCTTSDFLSSLQLVSRAIGSQQALPILGNVLIDSQYRTDRTYPKPKPRDEPRVPFYQRVRAETLTVVVSEKSEAEK
jgi:hypothetical protein